MAKERSPSLFGIQAVVSAVSGKVLNFEIESRFRKDCQAHGSWDRGSERFRMWKESHTPTLLTQLQRILRQHGAAWDCAYVGSIFGVTQAKVQNLDR